MPERSRAACTRSPPPAAWSAGRGPAPSLIPVVGTRRTFLVFGLACAVVAVTGLARRRVAAFAVPAVIVLLLALPVGTIKASDSGKVLEEVDTEYQYARVVEETDGDRKLELNEGQAVHSLYRPGPYLAAITRTSCWCFPSRRPPSAGAAWRYSGTPPARRLARSGTSSRARRRRRRDRSRPDQARPPLVRPPKPAPDRSPRRCAAVPAAHGSPLRRGRDRCLPAALHPVLPGDAGVLRARARPSASRRRGAHQHRPSAGEDALEKVLTATMGAVFPTIRRDPAEDTNTQLLGTTGSLPAAHWPRQSKPSQGAEAAGPRDGGQARARAGGRTGLYGRPRAGRMADRQIHRRLCGRRVSGRSSSE